MSSENQAKPLDDEEKEEKVRLLSGESSEETGPSSGSQQLTEKSDEKSDERMDGPGKYQI